jgi:HEPN domain-containing protein
MNDPKMSEKMLKSAYNDLQTMKALLSASEPYPDTAFGFNAQQAVEKALKAWLAFLGIRFHKNHDIAELFDQLEDAHESLPEPFKQFEELTEFAVLFRYDPDAFIGQDFDKQALYDSIKRFLEYVETHISTH